MDRKLKFCIVRLLGKVSGSQIYSALFTDEFRLLYKTNAIKQSFKLANICPWLRVRKILKDSVVHFFKNRNWRVRSHAKQELYDILQVSSTFIFFISTLV